MAQLVRAIYSSTCAATGGPDKPGHDDEARPRPAGKQLILRLFPRCVRPVGTSRAMTNRTHDAALKGRVSTCLRFAVAPIGQALLDAHISGTVRRSRASSSWPGSSLWDVHILETTANSAVSLSVAGRGARRSPSALASSAAIKWTRSNTGFARSFTEEDDIALRAKRLRSPDGAKSRSGTWPWKTPCNSVPYSVCLRVRLMAVGAASTGGNWYAPPSTRPDPVFA